MSLSLHAQDSGTASGLVVSMWDGSPLPGVVITVRGTTLAAQTDPSGHFELKNIPPGDQVLRFSKSGYASAAVTDVRVLIGQNTTVNGNLRPEFYEMEEYEVTAEEFTEQTEQILIERKQASGLMEAIGSEQFSRVGAGDAAEIVAHVTGVSIVEGKFAVIRGLNDRYTSTLLNGGDVPSADPYRKAAQLDLFPSEMIDQVQINKTFTPDQPGGFAGGSINVITKPFPEKAFINFSAGAAYNTQATGNDKFLTGPKGDLDYFAMDDGLREIPSGVQGTGTFTRDKAVADQVVSALHSMSDPLFAPTRSAPGPDNNWALSLGNTWKLSDPVKLGFIGGLNHEVKYRYFEDGDNNRFNAGTNGQLSFIRSYRRDRGSEETQWGGVAGLSLEVTEHHRLSYAVVNNQSAENVGQVQQGTSVILGGVALTFKGYTERNLFNQQFRGEHEFPFLHDLRFDWLASLSDTSQNEPSLRYYPMQLTATHPDGIYDITSAGSDIPDARAPTLYSRFLTENNENYRVDWTLPFGKDKEHPRDLKFGLNFSSSERQYDDQRLLFEINESLGPQSGTIEMFPNQNLDLGQYGYTVQIIRRGNVSVTNYVFNHPITVIRNGYTGTQELPAGYLMLDWSLTDRLRVMGGARYEETKMEAIVVSGESGLIDEKDWLPAAGLTIQLRKNMNLRFNYSETIARPTFREFAPVDVYDFFDQEQVRGNPNLRRSQIKNYDMRWEWFPGPGDILSAGMFYKQLTDSIEKYRTRDPDRVSFINRPDATLYGFELEARKNLGFAANRLSGFTLGGNFTYVDGTVTIQPDIDADGTVFNPGGERDSLFEQSKYIINADLSYDHPKSGFSFTVSYNVASERLVVAGENGPDIYEQPAPSLDVVLSRKFGKHWKLKASAKNLLNPKIEKIYGKEGDFPNYGPYSSYQKGITVGISLSAEF